MKNIHGGPTVNPCTQGPEPTPLQKQHSHTHNYTSTYRGFLRLGISTDFGVPGVAKEANGLKETCFPTPGPNCGVSRYPSGRDDDGRARVPQSPDRQLHRQKVNASAELDSLGASPSRSPHLVPPSCSNGTRDHGPSRSNRVGNASSCVHIIASVMHPRMSQRMCRLLCMTSSENIRLIPGRVIPTNMRKKRVSLAGLFFYFHPVASCRQSS